MIGCALSIYISVPSHIYAQKLYRSFVQFTTVHIPVCQHLPASARNISAKTLLFCARDRMETKKYWEESARKVGLMDAEDGTSIVLRPAPIVIKLAGPKKIEEERF